MLHQFTLYTRVPNKHDQPISKQLDIFQSDLEPPEAGGKSICQPDEGIWDSAAKDKQSLISIEQTCFKQTINNSGWFILTMKHGSMDDC